MINEGQSNFLTLTQGHCNIKIKLTVFSEITGPMKVKFYVEPPCLGGTLMRKIWVECSTWLPCSLVFFRTGGPIFTKLGM